MYENDIMVKVRKGNTYQTVSLTDMNDEQFEHYISTKHNEKILKNIIRHLFRYIKRMEKTHGLSEDT